MSVGLPLVQATCEQPAMYGGGHHIRGRAQEVIDATVGLGACALNIDAAHVGRVDDNAVDGIGVLGYWRRNVPILCWRCTL